MEKWCAIPGYKGLYSVSDIGRVRSEDRTAVSFAPRSLTGLRRVGSRMLKPAFDSDGYPRVVLCLEGQKQRFTVHRLVLLAFKGPRPDGLQSLHGDGNPANCSLANLRYGTQQQNAEDARKHGTLYRGERHHKAKLTESDIRSIRGDSRSSTVVAQDFGINRNNVDFVRKGLTWRHVL